MSDLEAAFDHWWRVLAPDCPAPVREYRFDTVRRWRADFAWPESKLLLEMEGGVWLSGGGRHNRAISFESDIEKYNAATLLGYRVLRYTATMLYNNPQRCVDEVRQALGGAS